MALVAELFVRLIGFSLRAILLELTLVNAAPR
jgi:hypothetical protein